MLIPRMEGEPSPVIAFGGFGLIIGAALGAVLLGGGSGFVGIIISALIGALAGMILGRVIQ
jgi:hypothetical protein